MAALRKVSHNPQVVGSSPTAATNAFNNLPEIRRNPHFAWLRGTWLRGSCGLLRSCFRLFCRDPVKPVYKTNVGTGNQVAVNVDCDLNGTVPHLLFHADNRGSVLEEQRSERMTEIVQANPANASLGQHRKKYAMVEVIRVDNRPLRGPKNQFAGDIALAF